MRELELGKVYELQNKSGSHQQKIVFATETEDGTTPSEVLNVVIEKLYSNQFQNFSCETATALEFLKAARRSIVKQLAKSRQNERKDD